ncbi:hypothetical protein ACFSJQ_21265 [Vibrio olivae]
MEIHLAIESDISVLAELNHQLIKDEGHRNPMLVEELKGRMRSWLSSDYSAALFVDQGEITGYTLWRQERLYLHPSVFY